MVGPVRLIGRIYCLICGGARLKSINMNKRKKKKVKKKKKGEREFSNCFLRKQPKLAGKSICLF